MDLMKKAAAAITRTDNQSSDMSDLNLYAREVEKNGEILQDTTSSESAKIAAIKMLGFVGYLANPDVSRVLATYIPSLLSALKDERSPRKQLEVVRALSGICHRNRVTQESVLADTDALNVLLAMMNNTDNYRAGRWASYTLVVMLSDNVPFMRRLSMIPEVGSCLEAVARVDLPWTAWGMNYAVLGLAMLGFWPVTKNMMDSLHLPMHYYGDGSDDEYSIAS